MAMMTELLVSEDHGYTLFSGICVVKDNLKCPKNRNFSGVNIINTAISVRYSTLETGG